MWYVASTCSHLRKSQDTDGNDGREILNHAAVGTESMDTRVSIVLQP